MLDYHWFLLIGAVVISSFSQIILKKGASKNYNSVIREYLNPYVIFGYGLMVLTTVLTVLAYAGLEYKNGPIIESIGYVLVMLLSALFFKEKISLRKAVGNTLIILGIVVYYI